MEANQENNNYTPVMGKTVAIDQWVLFGLNALLLLVYVLRQFSLRDLIVCLCIVALLAVLRKKEPVPAAASIPLYLMADGALILSRNLNYLISDIDNLHVEYVLIRFSPIFLVLLVAGIVLYYIARSKSSSLLRVISLVLLGFALGFYVSQQNSFTNSNRLLMVLVLTGCFCWIVLQRLISLTIPQAQQSTRWASFVVILYCATLLLLSPTTTGILLSQAQASAEALLSGSLTGWKLLFAVGLGLGLLVLLFKTDGGRLSVDAYCLILALEIYLSILLLTCLYSPFNWVLGILLVTGTIRCMRNDYAGRKTFGLSSHWYLLVQLGVFCIAVLLFRKGLWLNCLFTILLLLLFANKQDAFWNGKEPLFWILAETGIILEAASLLFQYRRSLSVLAILGAVLVMAVLTTIILHTDHSLLKLKMSKWVMPAICTALAVVCLLPMLRFGVSIRCEQGKSLNSSTVTVTVVPRGKGNSIHDAYSYGRPLFGKKLDWSRTSGQRTTVSRSGDVLVIVAMDKHGVESRAYHWWIPSFLLKK